MTKPGHSVRAALLALAEDNPEAEVRWVAGKAVGGGASREVRGHHGDLVEPSAKTKMAPGATQPRGARTECLVTIDHYILCLPGPVPTRLGCVL